MMCLRYKHHHDFSCLHIWKCLCDQLEKKDDVALTSYMCFLGKATLQKIGIPRGVHCEVEHHVRDKKIYFF